MNPFEMLPKKKAELLIDWEKMWAKPYNKYTCDPYTRTRVILMNGCEFENVWFSHQNMRNIENNELRRLVALIRRSEQQQQKLLAHLKPQDETALEHTIGYEQLAVDLTAHLAKRVTDKNVKNALDFALLEDFDHLYRYSDYLDMTEKAKAEALVGGYTEIMPGRPTVSHHRHPYDSIRHPMTKKDAKLIDILAANVITAAEQQTMNYYMNTASLWPEETGRRLYQEIGMVEEQHVSQYGSLLNPHLSFLENLVVHQYAECWLYYSAMETETDRNLQKLWEFMFEQELMHLSMAKELMEKQEGREAESVLPSVEFPDVLKLESNIDYVRNVLNDTVYLTALRENYADVRKTPEHDTFFDYQHQVNGQLCNVMSHTVIEKYIEENGKDYRFELAPNPVAALRDRHTDNTDVGRKPEKVLQKA